MLSLKWWLYPVISGLLFAGSSVGAIAQSNWIELGREDNILYQMNPELQISGAASSVVAYELWLTPPQEINGVRSSKIQIIARCESRSQALSQIKTFNSQGLSIKVTDYDIADPSAWETPKQNIFGKAFNMACNSR